MIRVLVKRVLLWWATVQLTPEDLAARAWAGRGLERGLNGTYTALFSLQNNNAGETQGLALAAHSLAVRSQN